MLAKVRCVCHVHGTDFGAPGDMLAIVDADWGRALGSAWGADASKNCDPSVMCLARFCQHIQVDSSTGSFFQAAICRDANGPPE